MLVEVVVVISTRCVFMVDTCGPGVVSSTYDMLEISVVHGVKRCRWSV